MFLLFLTLLIVASWVHNYHHTTQLHRKVDTLQGVPVIKKVVGGKRVVCPICDTSYSFKQLNIEKTGPNDKALVQCVCANLIEVSFDAAGNAQCQV